MKMKKSDMDEIKYDIRESINRQLIMWDETGALRNYLKYLDDIWKFINEHLPDSPMEVKLEYFEKSVLSFKEWMQANHMPGLV